jgi:hypothetical protein
MKIFGCLTKNRVRIKYYNRVTIPNAIIDKLKWHDVRGITFEDGLDMVIIRKAKPDDRFQSDNNSSN